MQQIRAFVIQRYPVESGTSKAGKAWSKATIIVETEGQYPKKVAITNTKNPLEFATIPAGVPVVFDVDIDSREYNGKWYTNVTCYKWHIENY